ncbi:MAG: HAD family hydrolase [Bacteroidota bacterium]
MIRLLLWDLGDTVMRDDPDMPGMMCDWEHVEWIPGAEAALIRLSPEIPCVIATNPGQSDTPAVIRALQRVGADKYFTDFFSAKDIGFEKPDPRFFLTIAERTGIAAADCAMIGNNYKKDIEGAHIAGMKTVFFNEDAVNGDYPDADAIIHRMDELPEAIARLKDKKTGAAL